MGVSTAVVPASGDDAAGVPDTAGIAVLAGSAGDDETMTTPSSTQERQQQQEQQERSSKLGTAVGGWKSWKFRDRREGAARAVEQQNQQQQQQEEEEEEEEIDFTFRKPTDGPPEDGRDSDREGGEQADDGDNDEAKDEQKGRAEEEEGHEATRAQSGTRVDSPKDVGADGAGLQPSVGGGTGSTSRRGGSKWKQWATLSVPAVRSVARLAAGGISNRGGSTRARGGCQDDGDDGQGEIQGESRDDGKNYAEYDSNNDDDDDDGVPNVDQEEGDFDSVPVMPVGTMIGLMDRMELSRELDDITFPEGSRVGIKFRGISARSTRSKTEKQQEEEQEEEEDYGGGDSVEQRAAEEKICGFIDYEHALVDEWPELGARLVAINGKSIECGDWNLKLVGEEISKDGGDGDGDGGEGKGLCLSYRNDVLSSDDVETLNRILAAPSRTSRDMEEDGAFEGQTFGGEDAVEEEGRSKIPSFNRLRNLATRTTILGLEGTVHVAEVSGEPESAIVSPLSCLSAFSAWSPRSVESLDEPGATATANTSCCNNTTDGSMTCTSSTASSVTSSAMTATAVDETPPPPPYCPPNQEVFEYFAMMDHMKNAGLLTAARDGGVVVTEGSCSCSCSGNLEEGDHDLMSSTHRLSASTCSLDRETEAALDRGANYVDAETDGGSRRPTLAGLDVKRRPNMADLFASARPNRWQSPKLLKATQSLGWRDRYSQADLYPVHVMVPGVGAAAAGAALPDTTTTATVPEQRTFHVRQVQGGETEGTYGTGATVWPASIVLLKYLESRTLCDPSLMQGKNVIDLGSGTAVTSIAAALLGARLVICTDGNDHVIRLAKDVVRMVSAELRGGSSDTVRNQLELDASRVGFALIGDCEVRVQKYCWGEDDASMLDIVNAGRGIHDPASDERRTTFSIDDKEGKYQRCKYFDIILVSDCVLPKLYPIYPLIRAISQLSGPETVAYVSYEHRHYSEYDPRVKFREVAEDEGLEVRVVPMEEQDPIYSVDDIEIWEIRSRKERELGEC